MNLRVRRVTEVGDMVSTLPSRGCVADVRLERASPRAACTLSDIEVRQAWYREYGRLVSSLFHGVE
jgi:hypothetical protein